MYKYNRNNIHFKILSANEISIFKMNQVKSFQQITRNDLLFSENCKECVLLEYDKSSILVYLIERLCLNMTGKYMTNDIIDYIFTSFEDSFKDIEDIIYENQNIFSNNIISFIRFIHQYSLEILKDILFSTLPLTIDSFFPIIMNYINSYLSHILCAIHEFNNIQNNIKQPFLTTYKFGSENIIPEKLRAIFYNSVFRINNFIHKNYSENTSVFETLSKILKEYDIEIESEFNEIEEQSEIM